MLWSQRPNDWVIACRDPVVIALANESNEPRVLSEVGGGEIMPEYETVGVDDVGWHSFGMSLGSLLEHLRTARSNRQGEEKATWPEIDMCKP